MQENQEDQVSSSTNQDPQECPEHPDPKDLLVKLDLQVPQADPDSQDLLVLLETTVFPVLLARKVQTDSPDPKEPLAPWEDAR